MPLRYNSEINKFAKKFLELNHERPILCLCCCSAFGGWWRGASFCCVTWAHWCLPEAGRFGFGAEQAQVLEISYLPKTSWPFPKKQCDYFRLTLGMPLRSWIPLWPSFIVGQHEAVSRWELAAAVCNCAAAEAIRASCHLSHLVYVARKHGNLWYSWYTFSLLPLQLRWASWKMFRVWKPCSPNWLGCWRQPCHSTSTSTKKQCFQASLVKFIVQKKSIQNHNMMMFGNASWGIALVQLKLTRYLASSSNSCPSI